MSNYIAEPGIENNGMARTVRDYQEMMKVKNKTCFPVISNIVEEYFNINREKLREKTREREVVHPRQVVMYFSRKYTNKSLAAIGWEFGGKDHATVSHACKTVENEIDRYPRIRDEIDSIEKKIRKALDYFVDGEYKLDINRRKNVVTVYTGVRFNINTFNKVFVDLKEKKIDEGFKVDIL